MGTVRTVTCTKCGFTGTYFLGCGMMFPQVYQEAVGKIRRGEYGQQLRSFFEKYPGAVVNAVTELYQCGGCGHLQEDYNLSLYVHKNGQPPENGYWMRSTDYDEQYSYIRSYVHKCPECGQRMHKITEEMGPIRCPECGEMLEGDPCLALWD